MAEVDLSALLTDVDSDVRTELESMPEVEDRGTAFDAEQLPIVARKWHKLDEAVAVVADLKSSTQLGLNKRAPSTASIYQASTGSIVKIFDKFEADFIAIQGDGVFALFWNDRRFERALCAGITIKTFSSKSLVERLEKRWDGLPETGLKVGIASSPLLAKRVGVPRQLERQEPVWAGRAVNYAAKCAQLADRHEMIVTGSVWDHFSSNEYVAATCGCGSGEISEPVTTLWEDVVIEKIPDQDSERQGKKLTSSWCDVHGPEFCAAIENGEAKRTDDVGNQVEQAHEAELSIIERANAWRDRNRRARKHGRLG